MGDIHNTQFFRTAQENKMDVSQVLEQVYTALTEKGYNPVSQIVGYIMSGDPTYITSHKNARSLIMNGGSGHQQHDLRRGLFPAAHFSSPFPIFCPHHSAGELKFLLRTKT